MENKNIKLKITSTQEDISQEATHHVYSGVYAFVAGKHIIKYEEFFQDENEPPAKSSNIIKISQDCIDIHKNGAITTKMHFEEGKKHQGIYKTPYGNFQMEIHTHQLHLPENAATLESSISYSLFLNGSKISKCTITLQLL